MSGRLGNVWGTIFSKFQSTSLFLLKKNCNKESRREENLLDYGGRKICNSFFLRTFRPFPEQSTIVQCCCFFSCTNASESVSRRRSLSKVVRRVRRSCRHPVCIRKTSKNSAKAILVSMQRNGRIESVRSVVSSYLSRLSTAEVREEIVSRPNKFRLHPPPSCLFVCQRCTFSVGRQSYLSEV
jgi:hypothetical protein